jgi:rhomboid protease GluP
VEGNEDDPTTKDQPSEPATGQASEPATGQASEPATARGLEARLDAELAEFPAPVAPDPAARRRAAELAEFRARLVTLTPRIVVTPALIAANVIVFGLMVARGVSPLSPTTDALLSWGANFGRLSAGGQWWRLVTAMFLHVGVIHLLMNMWVLWDGGRLVERMLGPVAFAAAYVLAGLAGSCASALWSPDRPSAGASGAIFGIFGLLGAFLVRQRRAMPPGALSTLARSSLFFVGYNVLYGLTKPNIDMAAHLGGLAGGFAAGLPLVHALTPEARAGAWRRAAVVMAVGLVALGGLWSGAGRLLALQTDTMSLAPRELPGASIRFPRATDPDDHLDYAEGRIRSALGEPSYLLLSWSTTEMMTEAELRSLLIDPIVQSLKASMPAVNVEQRQVAASGGKGFRYLLHDTHGRSMVVATIWPCGKRVFTLSGGGAGVALEATARESFACNPDPARDGKEAPIGVQLDVGPEFGLVATTDTFGVMSLDGEVFVVARFPGEKMTDEAANELVPRLLSQLAGTFLETKATSFGPMTRERGPAGERAVWRGTGSFTDETLRLLGVEINCGRDRYLAIYYGDAALPEARSLAPLLAARCTDAPKQPPPMTKVARAACARGDERGCTIAKSLSDTGGERADGADHAGHPAR